jgi:hypothetical protein
VTFETISNFLPTGYVMQDRLEKRLGVEGLHGLSSILLMHVLQLCLRGGSDDLDGGLSTLTTVLCMCSLSLVLLITFCFAFQAIALEIVLSGWESWARQRERGSLIVAIKHIFQNPYLLVYLI